MYKISPKTSFVGRKLVFLPTCHSTNDTAATLLAQPNVAEGTTVVTFHQTAGRGQRGNTWEAEPGKNLTFSVILKPDFLLATRQFYLNMAVSVAILHFLTDYLPESSTIKWPNDVYFQEKKLGGILIENTLKYTSLESSIIGVGLNMNQEQFAEPKAISLKQITGEEHSLPELLADLLAHLEQQYVLLRNGQTTTLRHTYLQHLYGFGRTRQFRDQNGEFTGSITGIDEYGRLGVQSADGQRYYAFKEIAFIH